MSKPKRQFLAFCASATVSLTAVQKPIKTIAQAFGLVCAMTSGLSAQDMSALEAERYERRAVEAAIWGMPIVNLWAMRERFNTDAGVNPNAVAYFSKPMDWKLQVTTPNNTTLYILSFWNTQKDGPIVVEVPPTTDTIGLFGTAMDAWHRPLVDMGGQGFDRGQGGKYLFLPPGYDTVPPEGYIPVESPSNNGWFLLRTLVPNFEPETLAAGEAFINEFKVYPLSQADDAPETEFVDIAGVEIDGIAPYDDRFFDALNQMLQEEPVAEQDLVAMGMLHTLGIEKGAEFAPSEEQRAILSKAASQAQDEFKEMVTDNPDRYWDDRRWAFLLRGEIVQQTDFTFAYPRMLDYTYRGVTYYSAFSSVVTYGTQTQYLVGGLDKDGKRLDGGTNYVFNVPADSPVKQFWSSLVYDLDTAAFVKNTPKAGVSSLDTGLIQNEDGSVDVYLGPEVPAGKEANWAPTVAGRDYFLLFRFYGPKDHFYDKSWKLGDLERTE